MSNSRNRPYRRLRIEQLEDRWTPAMASFDPISGTLSIVGTAGPDEIGIIADSTGNVKVDLDFTPPLCGEGLDLGGHVSFDNVKLIDIETHGGDDGVFLDYLGVTHGVDAPGESLVMDEFDESFNIQAALGNGDDTLCVHAVGTIVNDWTLSGTGGNGADVLRMSHEGTVALGADLRTELHGGNGKDILSVSLLTNIESAAGVTVLQSGGNGNDSISFTYSGVPDGDLEVTVDGGNGNDLLAADVVFLAAPGESLTDMAAVPLANLRKLSIQGNEGDDHIVVMFNPNEFAVTKGVRWEVGGGKGRDDLNLGFDFDDLALPGDFDDIFTISGIEHRKIYDI